MKENTRIELTQDQYDALSAIGVADCEIKTIGCTMSIGGPSSDHHMTVGVKKSITGGNHMIDNIDTTPIQVESFAGGAEWKNGDECVYQNSWGIVVGWHPQHPLVVIDTNEGLAAVRVGDLAKPETEAERNERERLEAAYDLYLTRHVSMPAPYHYDEFLKNERTLDGFLAIVDKTGYRKAVTNE